MLGLGETLTSFAKPFSPNDIANLVRWYKVNTGIVGASGGASDDGDMANDENITKWGDQTGTADAVQATANDQPHWDTNAADIGGLKFDNLADMTFTSLEITTNTNFTVVMRIKPIAFQSTDVLLSDQNNDFFRLQSNANVRVKMAATSPNNNNFFDGSNTISTSVYSTLILVRSGDSTGTLNVYIKASNGDEIDWASAAGAVTDADAFVMSMIGSQTSGNNELNAFIKDILIYNGTALDVTQRTDMYSYLESQVY